MKLFLSKANVATQINCSCININRNLLSTSCSAVMKLTSAMRGRRERQRKTMITHRVKKLQDIAESHTVPELRGPHLYYMGGSEL